MGGGVGEAGVISRRTIIRPSIQSIKNAANMAIGRFIAGAGYAAAANALAAMAKNKRIRKKDDILYLLFEYRNWNFRSCKNAFRLCLV